MRLQQNFEALGLILGVAGAVVSGILELTSFHLPYLTPWNAGGIGVGAAIVCFGLSFAFRGL